MKTQIERLDATPNKRVFLSIIADYDLNKSLCELVDNGIDEWVRTGKNGTVTVDVTLDVGQQIIRIADDAGGLKKSELRNIVGPGLSATKETDATIGIFGVGTKRAVVALAQEVRITTRHSKSAQTYQVEFDDQWIDNDEDGWELPLFQVDNISKGTTIVELRKLRLSLDDATINLAREHLGMTYARFVKSGDVIINVNGDPIKPQFFEKWAYPPDYSPRRYTATINVAQHKLAMDAVAGLSSESSPGGGEYGVYFYCNDRLIARALKTLEMGFARGLAGAPHPKLSLVRIIISLKGDAMAMPWNSSKSDISTNHEAFRQLHTWLVETLSYYASLSRNWMGEWPEKVFKYTTGAITKVSIPTFETIRKAHLPPLPKVRPRYGDVVEEKNAAIARKKPWTRGLYEGVIAADMIAKQRYAQKNRISLIVLDSTLEIAFKEFLVNDSNTFYKDNQLRAIFAARHLVHTEIKKFVKFTTDTWKKIEHYYRIRCNLVHERANVTITDADLNDYRAVIEKVLAKMFGLKFAKGR